MQLQVLVPGTSDAVDAVGALRGSLGVATAPMWISVAETAAGDQYVHETDHAVQIRRT